MFKDRLAKILSILFLIFITSCTYAVRYDGTYSGKVIDSDTGEPIEGVVVLGTWHTYHVGNIVRFADARETVTDKDGEFSIPGRGLRIMSSLAPMDVLIFKAGYKYVQGSWKSFKEGFYYKDKIKWEDGNPIIPLKKLTMEERMRRGSPPSPPDEALLDKVILMLREIDKDRKERGLDTRRIWRGKEYE